MRDVQLEVSDFETVVDRAGRGDVIFADPTYTVVHETNNFVRYNERIFSWLDQIRLVEAAKRAYARGALVIVSNACHPSLAELYQPFEPIRLVRKSLVSRKVQGRRQVSEYLFVLFPIRSLSHSSQENS